MYIVDPNSDDGFHSAQKLSEIGEFFNLRTLNRSRRTERVETVSGNSMVVIIECNKPVTLVSKTNCSLVNNNRCMKRCSMRWLHPGRPTYRTNHV